VRRRDVVVVVVVVVGFVSPHTFIKSALLCLCVCVDLRKMFVGMCEATQYACRRDVVVVVVGFVSPHTFTKFSCAGCSVCLFAALVYGRARAYDSCSFQRFSELHQHLVVVGGIYACGRVVIKCALVK